MNELNYSADHVAKQRKKKDLGNNMAYFSLNGVSEMHPIGQIELKWFKNKQLQEIITELYTENKILNERIDKMKGVIANKNGILDRLDKIERKMKEYGYE